MIFPVSAVEFIQLDANFKTLFSQYLSYIDSFLFLFLNLSRHLKSKNGLKSNTVYVFDWVEKHDTIPKLRDVRGKMFFIDKEGHGKFGLNKNKISKKDDFEWPGYQTKMNGIKAHLNKASNSYYNSGNIFMTFVSANGAKKSLTNWQIARGVTVTWSLYNKIKYWDFLGMTVHVENYLMEKQRSSKTYGIVIFDYPTPKSIGKVNFLVKNLTASLLSGNHNTH